MFVGKRQIFNHKSLNNQFTVVLDNTISFSVRFCDNSLLALKPRFQVFPFASKNLQEFYEDIKEDINIVVFSCCFIYKSGSKFFKFLIFSQDI